MSENGVLSKYWITELTRPAFEDWLENEENPVVIIGIGSIEQHGPHLPLGMDSLAVKALIHKVASRTNSVCVHPCWPGYSPHHMGFAGTITFSWETLMGVLMDTIGSLAYHGIKRFVLMNGHGGNTATMNLVAQTAKREFDVMIAVPSGPSTAQALFPELLEMWRLPEDWKPSNNMTKELKEMRNPNREDWEVVSQVFGACAEPDTDDFTTDGVYGWNSPLDADPDEAAARIEERVEFIAEFIRRWKKIPTPPAFDV